MSEKTVVYATFSFFAFLFLAMGLEEIFHHGNMKVFVPLMKGFLCTAPIFIHTSFLFYYFVVNELGDQENGLLEQFDKYKNLMGAFYFIGLALLRAYLFVMIFLSKSHYPRWFSWLNPLVFIILL